MIYYFSDQTFKNIVSRNNNIAFIDELNKLSGDINNLFKNCESDIKNMLLKKKLKLEIKKLLLLMLYVIFSITLSLNQVNNVLFLIIIMTII